MPNGTYGGVRGKETKVGQKTFVSRPTRLCTIVFRPSEILVIFASQVTTYTITLIQS